MTLLTAHATIWQIRKVVFLCGLVFSVILDDLAEVYLPIHSFSMCNP